MKKTQNKTPKIKVPTPLQMLQVKLDQHQLAAQKYAEAVNDAKLDTRNIASIPAVKLLTPSGPEGPTAITIAELLTMAKMAKLSKRTVILKPDYSGEKLDIIAAAEIPAAPDALLFPLYSVEVK